MKKTARKPRRRKRSRLDPRRGLVAVSQAVGKTVEELTVASSYDDNGIDIFFDDQSGLSFSFETALKLRVSHTDGGAGDQWRTVKRWSRVKPE